MEHMGSKHWLKDVELDLFEGVRTGTICSLWPR